MSQFDIFENVDEESKGYIPFLLDVQHDLHRNLATRTVIPLVLIHSNSEEIKKLCPVFSVLGKDVMMSTPEMAGYPVQDLGSKVTSVVVHRTKILGAIDFLLSGF